MAQKSSRKYDLEALAVLARTASADNAEAAAGLPPVHDWTPDRWDVIDIRILRDGTWLHEGTPILRPALVKLFSRILRKDPDGFVLVTPAEGFRIAVEDAPFQAVEMHAAGEGPTQMLRFRTNVDDEVVADADHPVRVVNDPQSGTAAPYVEVRAGLEARLARPVYYELAERVVSGPDGGLGVWSGGAFFPVQDGSNPE